MITITAPAQIFQSMVIRLSLQVRGYRHPTPRRKDRVGRIKILKRIEKASEGNWGDIKPVPGSGGLSEMRIDYGPGYRVYCGRTGRTVYLLIAGGSKRTQASDIRAAKAAWREIKEGRHDHQKD